MYLTRLFFIMPKNQLIKVANAFHELYNLSLLDYINARLKEVNLIGFNFYSMSNIFYF